MTTTYRKRRKRPDEENYYGAEYPTRVAKPQVGEVPLGKAYSSGFGLRPSGQPAGGNASTYSRTPAAGNSARASAPNTYSHGRDTSPERAISDVARARSFTYGGSKPVYASPYSERIEKLFRELTETPEFTYDHENDENYLALEKNYSRAGRRAMEDTMASAAAQTGGIASSYAVSAGAQEYGRYMSALAEEIPELRSFAYGVYRDGIDSKRDDLHTLLDLEEAAYGRYGDELAAYYEDYDRAYGEYTDSLERADALDERDYQRATDERDFLYRKEQDELDRENYLKELEYRAEQDSLDRAYDYERLEYQKYADSLDRQDSRDDEAYDREQRELDRAWDIAFAKASYGDYSDLDAIGLDAEEYAAHEEREEGEEISSHMTEDLLRQCVFTVDALGNSRQSSKGEAYVNLRRLYHATGMSQAQYDALVEGIEDYYK